MSIARAAPIDEIVFFCQSGATFIEKERVVADTKKRVEFVVIQNEQQADQALSEIGAAQRAIHAIDGGYQIELTALKQRYAQELVDPLDAINKRFVGLYEFAQSNRGTLLSGDSKTIKLPSGELRWRFTPFSVAFKNKMNNDEAVEALKEAGLPEFVRTKEEPNKEAMLKDAESRAKAAAVPGIKIVQNEEFVAKPNEGLEDVVGDVKKLLKAVA